MVCMEYNTTESADKDAHAFLGFITLAISTSTFMAYTAVTLTEEAMAVDSSLSTHLSSSYITMRPPVTGAFTHIPPLTGLTLYGYFSASP
jgi:hypothetical protein